MGCFLARGVSISPVVTPREYLDAVTRALDSLSPECERRGAAYARPSRISWGAELCGRPVSSHCCLERKPDDPTLHRMLGISYARAGNARLAVGHLTMALGLLERAPTPGLSLVHSLRIEFEASMVRLALMAAYEQLGHRAGLIRCLLAQHHPIAWDLHPRPRV